MTATAPAEQRRKRQKRVGGRDRRLEMEGELRGMATDLANCPGNHAYRRKAKFVLLTRR